MGKQLNIEIVKEIYRSEYIAFYEGTKTTKAVFTIKPFGQNKFMAYVYLKDVGKKGGKEAEFYGNLLWGYGKALVKEELIQRINSYNNTDEVKKDFDL